MNAGVSLYLIEEAGFAEKCEKLSFRRRIREKLILFCVHIPSEDSHLQMVFFLQIKGTIQIHER